MKKTDHLQINRLRCTKTVIDDWVSHGQSWGKDIRVIWSETCMEFPTGFLPKVYIAMKEQL